MNRKANTKAVDDMRPEYDFSGGVRGKFYKEYMKGTNVVLLDPDVAGVFPDSQAVNGAPYACSACQETGKDQTQEVEDRHNKELQADDPRIGYC